MREMRASAFKARCLKVMNDIQATGEPVVVTKRGKPVVKVIPIKSEKDDIFGSMADEVQIIGDIESPVVPLKALEGHEEMILLDTHALIWLKVEPLKLSARASKAIRTARREWRARHLRDFTVGVGVAGDAWTAQLHWNCRCFCRENHIKNCDPPNHAPRIAVLANQLPASYSRRPLRPSDWSDCARGRNQPSHERPNHAEVQADQDDLVRPVRLQQFARTLGRAACPIVYSGGNGPTADSTSDKPV